MDDFSKLIRLVRRLGDGELADWMRDKARSLPSFTPSYSLLKAFDWDECPFSDGRLSYMVIKIGQYTFDKRLTKKSQRMLDEVKWYVPRAYHRLRATMGSVKSWNDTDSLFEAFDWADTDKGCDWWREVWEELLRNVPRYRNEPVIDDSDDYC